MENISLNAKDMKVSSLVIIMFGMMCAGSFGVESMVGISGPGLGFLALIIVPIFWGIPIALISAELGAAYPEAGGSYVWAKRALGPFAAFAVGAGRSFYFWIGGGSLLALAMFYVQSYFGLGKFQAIGLMVLLAIICAVINIIGLDAASITSKLFTIIIAVPFIALVVLGLFQMEYNPITPIANPSNSMLSNIGYMFALGIWMYGGWENAASLAGEIRNFSKIFPKALAIVMVLMVITYLFPNLIGLSAVGHWELWGTEYDLVYVAELIGGPVLGILMLIAAIFSNVFLFSSSMLHTSRQPMVMAHDNLLPKCFGLQHKKYKTPWFAIVVQCIISCCALFFSFDAIVGFLSFLTFLMTAIYFLAAYRLRNIDPDTERPFKVPGGKVGIVLLFIPIIIISVYAVIGNGIPGLIGFVAFAIIIPVLYVIFKKIYGGYEKV